MHIVFVTSELATKNIITGGLGTFTANMARIFANKGHKVDILLVSTKEQIIEFDENIHVENISIPINEWKKLDFVANELSNGNVEKRIMIRRYSNIIYKAEKVAEYIRNINNRNQIDIVHYSNHGAFALFADTKIPYLIRISGFLNVWHGANNLNNKIEFSDNPENYCEKIEHSVLKNAKNVIAPSKLLGNMGESALAIEHIHVIESPYISQNNNWDIIIYEEYLKDKKYIIHYGNLKYMKGIHVVAGIANKILENHRDLYLVLAGNDNDLYESRGEHIKASEMVIRAAEEYSDRVIYVGKLNREQLYPLISNSMACILPSRIENLSNACIEAMALGKIVVATNGASYEQLIEDGVNGFLRERDNPDSFLEGIETALSLSEEEKEVMSENAKKTVERLSPDNIYKQYLAYYQKVIQEW